MATSTPKVSVIMPIYNTELYLQDCLDSVLNQTLPDFELICVDDGSTDGSVAILEENAKKDSRIHIVHQENAGAGAARNNGFRDATGEYTFFVDPDGFCDLHLLEKTVGKAEETNADIVAFDFYKLSGNTKSKAIGIHADWLPEGTLVFSRHTVSEKLLSIANPAPSTKLFRTSFLIEHKLKFDELSSTNEVTFSAVSIAQAEQIAFLSERLMTYRGGHSGTNSFERDKNVDNIVLAMESTVRQILNLPYSPELKTALWDFELDNYDHAVKHYISDWATEEARNFYNYLYSRFNSDYFSRLKESDISHARLYSLFITIKSLDYERFLERFSKHIIVSLTSYPARIQGIPTVLESIYSQTLSPHKIVLWLAEEQFPEKEKELPTELLQLCLSDKLDIRFCEDDLKPHKKYYYAMKEYPEDLIITIDDDLLYESDTIESLFWSYLRYPDCVSTVRTHLITAKEDGTFFPYNMWLMETSSCVLKPSFQLMATGGAGTLYPPHLFQPDLWNKNAIENTCLFADDLWMKANELSSNIPVVLAKSSSRLHSLPGRQDGGLWHSNVENLGNDNQWNNISGWFADRYGKNYLENKFQQPDENAILCKDQLVPHFHEYAKTIQLENKHIQRKLQQTYHEKSELNAKLQQTYDEKSELNAKLQQTYKEKSELNAKLQQTYKEKSELNAKLQQTNKEKSERGEEIRQLQAEITKLRDELNNIQSSKAYRLTRNIFKKTKR
jgi:glycosyltransferase involved in cell wall biosynthesis